MGKQSKLHCPCITYWSIVLTVSSLKMSQPQPKSVGAKVKKVPSSKTNKKSSTTGNGNPSYRSLITKALQASKERKGLSRPAIMKYIVGASVTPNTLLLNKMIKKMSEEGKVVPGAAVGKSGAGCFKLSAEERIRLAKDEKVAAKKELVKGKVRDEVKKGSKKDIPVAKKSASSANKTGKSVKAVKPGKVKQEKS